MTPRERAEQMNREEWEAERADLMRRALAYAARKRATEHARAVGVVLLEERLPTDRRHGARRVPRGRPAELHTHAGERKTLTEWAEVAGITYGALSQRMKHGRTLAVALAMASTGGRGATRHTINGVSMTLAEWAAEVSIPYGTLYNRMKRVGSLAEALTMQDGRRKRTSTLDRPAEGWTDRLDLDQTPGVPSDLGPSAGTGAGSTARETTNITFPEKAEAQ